MKIIKANAVCMPPRTNPLSHIECIARTCYKSEDKITGDSSKNFVLRMYNSGHHAMLEHYIFIYRCKFDVHNAHKYDCFTTAQYIISTSEVQLSTGHAQYSISASPYLTISFSARSLIDMMNNEDYPDDDKNLIMELAKSVVADYRCPEWFGNKFDTTMVDDTDRLFIPVKSFDDLTPIEKECHMWTSIKFICDRGVSHEIVRHRDASFAQESTRYCNYSKDKFSNELTMIEPSFYNPQSASYGLWKDACLASEKTYFNLLELNSTPQEARSILPNSLKTEVWMTARSYEWRHFFELRLDKAAHPQMREVANHAAQVICDTMEFPQHFMDLDVYREKINKEEND